MRSRIGQQRFLKSVLLGFLICSLSGCVYFLGGAGVLGGYIVSPDTMEGILVDRRQEDVFDAAVEVVSILGVISERSDKSGILLARIQGAKVTITVTAISESAVRLSVKARKALLPKVRLAQDIYVKIVNKSSE